jgi:hypothetical protein
MRELRLCAGITRWVLYAVAASGALASARFAIAPPDPAIERPPVVASRDAAAEGFASVFAMRYLTFDGARPERRQTQLAAFAGHNLDPDLGLHTAPGDKQRALWAQVVQSRPGLGPAREYTVAVQTDRSGLLYLSVGVARDPDRSLQLDGYPALVGAPASTGARAGLRMRQVDDRAVRSVCQRALRNYLAGAADDLDADLTPAARVAIPTLRLSLQRLDELDWEPSGASVLATVQAADAHGATYTLRYELDVVRAGARWEVAALQTDPTT